MYQGSFGFPFFWPDGAMERACGTGELASAITGEIRMFSWDQGTVHGSIIGVCCLKNCNSFQKKVKK
jgi:hypothetical protein